MAREPKEGQGSPPAPKRTRKPGRCARKIEKVRMPVPGGGWREVLRAAPLKFDDDAKNIFLHELASHGRKGDATRAAGVTGTVVQAHLRKDPEFAEAYNEALDNYRDRVVCHHQRLALEGVKEPIIGGPDRDEVVAEKTVYPIPLIQMELRRVDPSYRDKAEVDMTVRGGVLVVPSEVTMEEWMRLHGRPRPSSSENDE